MKPSLSELQDYQRHGEYDSGPEHSPAIVELLEATHDLLTVATAALKFATARHKSAPADAQARLLATLASEAKRFEP